MQDTTPTTPPDNRLFCEQLGHALLTLGTEETLACMARMMVAIAQRKHADLIFNCDLGTVTIERKTPLLQA